MSNKQIIRCTFCRGTGDNPHFRGTCPACKGRVKNEVVGKHMTCSSCRGSGQKGGTTLTCYDCGGLGVVPDTRETFIRAREEIKEAQEEIAREAHARQRPEPQAMAGGEELTERPKSKKHADKIEHSRQSRNKLLDIFLQKKDEEESGGKIHFCQCCANAVNESINIRICFDCFNEVKAMRAHKEI